MIKAFLIVPVVLDMKCGTVKKELDKESPLGACTMFLKYPFELFGVSQSAIMKEKWQLAQDGKDSSFVRCEDTVLEARQ